MLRGLWQHVRSFDIELGNIFFESLDVKVTKLFHGLHADFFALTLQTLNDFIFSFVIIATDTHIGDVHHLLDFKSKKFKSPANNVSQKERAEIAYMDIVVNRRA